MSKRNEKWYQTDWVKFVFSAAVSALFAWIFTFFNPIDESVQVEIEQLKASTEYLREATQKDAVIVGHLTNQIEQMQKAREKDDQMNRSSGSFLVMPMHRPLRELSNRLQPILQLNYVNPI